MAFSNSTPGADRELRIHFLRSFPTVQGEERGGEEGREGRGGEGGEGREEGRGGEGRGELDEIKYSGTSNKGPLQEEDTEITSPQRTTFKFKVPLLQGEGQLLYKRENGCPQCVLFYSEVSLLF